MHMDLANRGTRRELAAWGMFDVFSPGVDLAAWGMFDVACGSGGLGDV